MGPADRTEASGPVSQTNLITTAKTRLTQTLTASRTVWSGPALLQGKQEALVFT